MSAIAQNASITLITGVPGNGKSLRAVWYAGQAVKAGEQVYACNITGLRVPGVNQWEDPTLWEALPAGAILIVDEAQKFFRAGLTESYTDEKDGKQKQRVPMFIQNMETIRHSGIRLILITQSPALIHANIRALVGLHEHLVRQNGKALATVYRRSRVIDNVRSEKALAAEDHESWGFPTQEYNNYDSAEKHTVKYTMSAKAKRGIVLVCIAAALIGYAIWNGKRLGGGEEEKETGSGQTAAQAAGGLLPGSNTDEDGPKWTSPYQYAKEHLPRFPTMPWTAEVFDDRPPTADPDLYCMSSSPGEDAAGNYQDYSCSCVTEQNTVYDLTEAQCRKLARRGGEYNPYKQRQNEQIAQAPTEAPEAASPMVPDGIVLPGPQVAKYGDIAVPEPKKVTQ